MTAAAVPPTPSSLTIARTKLAESLALDDLTVAPSLDAIKALPAILVDPSYQWLDGSTDSGPGRVVHFEIEARVVVNAQEPIGALANLESYVELVLGRIPRHWRFARAEAPSRVQAIGGEITALASSLFMSTRYSIL